MKYSELKRFLRKRGCYCYEEGNRHEKWMNPAVNGAITVIGRHDKEEVKSGTLNGILEDLNIKKGGKK
ncbi:MAG: type II toxin-antitoxin system HicA family toxin [Treponema sp.]|nr:type II toxin-antitoxin system HicA family toxin [Treponema sp.]